MDTPRDIPPGVFAYLAAAGDAGVPEAGALLLRRCAAAPESIRLPSRDLTDLSGEFAAFLVDGADLWARKALGLQLDAELFEAAGVAIEQLFVVTHDARFRPLHAVEQRYGSEQQSERETSPHRAEIFGFGRGVQSAQIEPERQGHQCCERDSTEPLPAPVGGRRLFFPCSGFRESSDLGSYRPEAKEEALESGEVVVVLRPRRCWLGCSN